MTTKHPDSFVQFCFNSKPLKPASPNVGGFLINLKADASNAVFPGPP